MSAPTDRSGPASDGAVPGEVTGAVLAPLVLRALEDEAAERSPAERARRREPLHRALLVEPLCLALLGARASAGPTLRLADGGAVRLVAAPALGVPAPPLFVSGAALAAWGEAAGIWGDGVQRARVLDHGAAFPLLRGAPGAMLLVDETHALSLDAGELAALASSRTPGSWREELRALAAAGRGSEVALRLAAHPLYVLDHPDGGLLLVDGALPAFLHVTTAGAFAARLEAKLGSRPPSALVAATDLLQRARRSKRDVVLEPGADPIVLRWFEAR